MGDARLLDDHRAVRVLAGHSGAGGRDQRQLQCARERHRRARRGLDALETRDDFVPAGTIAFFTETACPTGWTEYGPADGRYVVAVTGGKTVPGPVGDPLANMGNPTHTHTIAHRHEWARYDATTHEWFSYSSAVAGSARVEIYDHSDGLNGEGSGFFPLSTTRNGPHYTGDPTVGASGSASTSAIAPYIQLRACRKD